jgi:uncharacterized protein (DUF1697 family)
MALVVLLRGVNVGTGRRFRPAALATQLRHLDAVNVGAAGTLVIRRPVTRTRLRAELLRRLPFVTEILICPGREVLRLVPPANPPRGAVPFVSVLSRIPRTSPALPLRLPRSGRWLVKVLSRDGRYVFGLYRRDMKVIGLLGQLDRLFGSPATTRSWNTLAVLAKVLRSPRVSTLR